MSLSHTLSEMLCCSKNYFYIKFKVSVTLRDYALFQWTLSRELKRLELENTLFIIIIIFYFFEFKMITLWLAYFLGC